MQVSVFFRTSPKHKLKIIKVHRMPHGPGAGRGNRPTPCGGPRPLFMGALAVFKLWLSGCRAAAPGMGFPSLWGRGTWGSFAKYTENREWELGVKGKIKRG